MKTIQYTLILLLFNFRLLAADLYFPPIIGNTWTTVAPESLGWNVTKIQPLYDFLEQENSKAFIVLKDGKIVLEKYFGSFTKDSLWYWASAGKTITSFLVGKAQEEGLLKISDLSSKYLGKGWTNCSMEQEDKITIRHQLTMSTGLDDGVPDNHCIINSCLIYKADAGTRWAYHNAPYTLLEKVLTNSTHLPINTYTQQKLGAKTGINGFWFTKESDNVFYSKPRNMARYGLLFQNDCIWNNDTILKDRKYFNEMVNTSQSINNSYGYLWWLNGKVSFMIPSLQIAFPGSYSPDAPEDMFAGLGKNGQIVCVSKSKGLVVVRMGDKPDDGGEMPFILCNQIWQKLNEIMHSTNSIEETVANKIAIYPNPANTTIFIKTENNNLLQYQIINTLGQVIQQANVNCNSIDVSGLQRGIHFIQFSDEKGQTITRKVNKD